MNIKDYFHGKGVVIFAMICVYAGIGAFLHAAGVLLAIIVLMEIILVLAGVIVLVWDHFKRKSYYVQLYEVIQALGRESYLLELPADPSFWDGRIVRQLLTTVGRDFNDKMAAQIRTSDEYRHYIESWVHEVKLPIATAKMLLENHPGEVGDSLGEELEKIQDYVQQALYYARSESVEKDYCISRTSLKELVLGELSCHARTMIQAGIRPSVEEIDWQVLADSKWCQFILRQLLSNAVKYRGKTDPVIEIRAFEEGQYVWLTITDNGIGIPEKDLARIFEKGFTGENGRSYGASTGMGLYLCRRLCDKMEMDIRIQSAKEQGTEAAIRFRKG